LDLPQVDDYRHLFLNDVPLIDVRAPVEFAQGAFPAASNLPLINDDERHEIGLRYSELGQESAVELGHELVHGELKAQRIRAWRAFADRHPNGVLYCFRGGMRSRISQQWLLEHGGILYPRVRGGYKALRRFLIEELERACEEIEPIVIGGRTGVGKTLLLEQLDKSPILDLEALAHHRGSAFGRHAQPQPSQIDFENRLSIALLKLRAAGHTRILVEDESKNIGSRHIPNTLYERIHHAPLLILEASLEQRVESTRREYIDQALAEYRRLFGYERGFELWRAYLLDSLDRIRKRLGDVRYRDLRQKMSAAIDHQRHTEDTGAHRAWIYVLLSEYYDPMYDYQIQRNKNRVSFTGDHNKLFSYLSNQGVTSS
jgi:tRNA 2-selenouridine synthase